MEVWLVEHILEGLWPHSQTHTHSQDWVLQCHSSHEQQTWKRQNIRVKV